MLVPGPPIRPVARHENWPARLARLWHAGPLTARSNSLTYKGHKTLMHLHFSPPSRLLTTADAALPCSTTDAAPDSLCCRAPSSPLASAMVAPLPPLRHGPCRWPAAGAADGSRCRARSCAGHHRRGSTWPWCLAAPAAVAAAEEDEILIWKHSIWWIWHER